MPIDRLHPNPIVKTADAKLNAEIRVMSARAAAAHLRRAILPDVGRLASGRSIVRFVGLRVRHFAK
jgi:hypothetical protein